MSSETSDSQERERQRRELTRTIQAEIIPRLMLAHRVEPPPRIVPRNDAAGSDVLDIAAFVERLLEPTLAGALAYVADARANGLDLESLFLDLLAPAAHLLGAQWELDEASFTDVTVGLTHLQHVVRELAPAFELEGRFPGIGHRAVLVPAPGDQHVFGLILLEEFFRRAGWDVMGAAAAAELDLVELVSEDYVALVGFSVADPRSIPALGRLISELRAESVNPDLIVMVGGHCVLEDPTLVETLGADETGRTALDAVNIANRRVAEIALLSTPSSEV